MTATPAPATLLTGARLGDQLVDVLILDGLIAELREHRQDTDASAADPPGVEVLALDGRWLVPGLWDSHVHLNQQALAVRRVDLSSARSAAQAADAMVQRLRHGRPEPGQPLVGHGFRDSMWPDAPSRQLLDSGTGDVPVVMVSGDLHSAWLNSAALSSMGFAEHPTGLLREYDCFAVVAALQDVPQATVDAWVTEAALAASARGVVGVTDLEMTDNLTSWARRFAAGFRTLRIEAGIYSAQLEAAAADGHYTGELLDGTAGMLSVGPFKVLTDGSLNTRTAFCVDAYPGTHDHGLATVSHEEVVRLMRVASSARITPAVHAIGDEANRLALDAFETVGCGGRIEHAQLLRDADLPRFAHLGVVASVQPEHAMDDRDVADHHWEGRTSRAFAYRSLLDAGAELLFGSDAPVSPLDPWVTMSAAVSRSRDGREPWHPEQAITFAEALAASTRSRVAVGHPADLVAVDRDPYGATGNELRSMPVALTMTAGTPTHFAL